MVIDESERLSVAASARSAQTSLSTSHSIFDPMYPASLFSGLTADEVAGDELRDLVTE